MCWNTSLFTFQPCNGLLSRISRFRVVECGAAYRCYCIGFPTICGEADTRLVWPSQADLWRLLSWRFRGWLDSVRCEGHRMMMGFVFVVFCLVRSVYLGSVVCLVGWLVLYLQFGSWIFPHSHFQHPAIASISSLPPNSVLIQTFVLQFGALENPH